jgi:hypothetical protein
VNRELKAYESDNVKDRLTRVWKFFRTYFRVTVKRSPSGWLLRVIVCPVLYFGFTWKFPSMYEMSLEKAIYVRLFPGFPKPGSEIKLTFQHVFERVMVEE